MIVIIRIVSFWSYVFIKVSSFFSSILTERLQL